MAPVVTIAEIARRAAQVYAAATVAGTSLGCRHDRPGGAAFITPGG
jgi:hypothetical protein